MFRHLKLGFAAIGICVAVGACGAGTSPGTGQGPLNRNDASTPIGSTTECTVDSDCGVGEIDHDIASRADCLCLYGCPYVVLNKTTISRRQSQYAALCDPTRNASGAPCGIDDCVVPPTPLCVAGTCALSRDAAR